MVANPAQQFVPVREVKNGVIVLKDGRLRGVLMASSLNFALKSVDEQQAIIGSFQTFLNTLDFSLEIVIHSRDMDIRPYLRLLEGRLEDQENELMRIQLKEYIRFVREFVDRSQVMRKYFYVVVPFDPLNLPRGSSSLFPFPGVPRKEKGTTESPSEIAFAQSVSQLNQRMSVVSQGLAAIGVRSAALSTEEVLELLYRSFNPDAGEESVPMPTAA